MRGIITMDDCAFLNSTCYLVPKVRPLSLKILFFFFPPFQMSTFLYQFIEGLKSTNKMEYGHRNDYPYV